MNMRPADYPPTIEARFEPRQPKCSRCRGWRYVCSCGCPNDVIDSVKQEELEKQGFKFSSHREHRDKYPVLSCPECSHLPFV
jgi:hypothetical protein